VYLRDEAGQTGEDYGIAIKPTSQTEQLAAVSGR